MSVQCPVCLYTLKTKRARAKLYNLHPQLRVTIPTVAVAWQQGVGKTHSNL